jgi:hypothetical protein
MNATFTTESEQTINELITPQKNEFAVPEGVVADGADLVPTVQYLM